MLKELTYNLEEVERLNKVFREHNLGEAKDLYPFLEDEGYHPHEGCYIGNGFNVSTDLFLETRGKSETRMGYLARKDNPAS